MPLTGFELATCGSEKEWKLASLSNGLSMDWMLEALKRWLLYQWIQVHHWIGEHLCTCIFKTSIFQFCTLRNINRWTKGFYFSNGHEILKSFQKYRKNILPLTGFELATCRSEKKWKLASLSNRLSMDWLLEALKRWLLCQWICEHFCQLYISIFSLRILYFKTH